MAKCGMKCEVFSRVCGYYRPITNSKGQPIWNKGKLEEFRDRKTYKLPDSQGMAPKNEENNKEPLTN